MKIVTRMKVNSTCSKNNIPKKNTIQYPNLELEQHICYVDTFFAIIELNQ